MRKFRILVFAVFALIFASTGILAQIASGGDFVITKTVIAAGGGSDISGGTFRVEGTSGQPVAGKISTGQTLSLRSGFWAVQPPITQPTISISGRVTTPFDQGLRNVVVTLIDSSGLRRRATSSSFGVFSFEGVLPGDTYIITVTSKRYRFEPKIILVSGSLTNVDFRGLE